MTIYDLRCDICGRLIPLPAYGVRFSYHPGRADLRDDSGLACAQCWMAAVRDLGEPGGGSACAACGTAVSRSASLHLRRSGEPASWRLCAADAAAFLNRLRTVEPKLDPATFRFPARERRPDP
jgi:hypothetical protein